MEHIERRLELIKMLRSEHEANIARIQKREYILYPNRKPSYSSQTSSNSYTFPDKYKSDDLPNSIDSSKKDYGFYMRLGICMGLFLGFVYMETQNITCFGVTHEQIQQAVSETIDMNSFAFMEQFPYTLEDK